MPDQEHLDHLRQGVQAWNAWRKQHPAVAPDLDGANLVRAQLSGIQLAGASLRRANLTRAKLLDADLRGADLAEARLLEAELSGADLREANLQRVELTGSKLIGCKLGSADLRGAQVGVINLREADLRNANLGQADLRESLLPSADLRGADMSGCLLLGAHLEGANLAGVRGLAPETLAQAHINEQTVSPDGGPEALEEGELLRHVYQLLLDLRRSLPDVGVVPEQRILEFNAAISRLEGLGHDLAELKVPESALSRGVASWDDTPGGEAFEMDLSQHVEVSVFRGRLDRAIDAFEIPTGVDKRDIAFTGLKN